MPQQDVAQRVEDIWAEFVAEGAPSSINLDSHSYERTSQNLKDAGRYSYEDAQVTKTCLHAHMHPNKQHFSVRSAPSCYK